MQQIPHLKQQHFLSSTFYKIQISYKKIICLCYSIGSVTKIVLRLHFLQKWMRDFNKLKRNMNDVIIVFLMSCFSFLSAIQSFIIWVTWTLCRKFILFRSKAPEVFFKVNLQTWKWHIWMGVPAKNLLRICRTPFSKSTSGFFIFLKK